MSIATASEPTGAIDAPQPTRPRARRTRQRSRADVAVSAVAAVASFSLVWVVYFKLTPASGAVGFVICWYFAFLLVVFLAVRERDGRLVATDRVIEYAIAAAAGLVVVVLGLLVTNIVWKGIPNLRPGFFTHSMDGTGPLAKATVGGALHSIVGTLEQVGIATFFSVPLGILTAVYLREIRGRFARPVRALVDAMSGVPSIVAGLFIYAIWVLQHGFSGFAASLALSILMLPTITRTSEEVLRLVPDGLREASLAVGASEWKTTWSVVLPTARAGLVTATLLGVARAAGDTAALIATTAGFESLNSNPFHGQQDSLPLFVYKQVRTGLIDAQTERAWTGAFVLLMLVLILFTTARAISRPRKVRVPRRSLSTEITANV